MGNINILWVDDEIEFLKPHILFLEQRNYNVTPCQSGTEALTLIHENDFDIVFLDENMPGLSGLETLSELKEIKATLPVVMITKSEEEYIMEDAIGNKIADYLIKPVNPNQILLSLKKNLDQNRLVSEKTSSNYLQEFRKISMNLNEINSFEEWEQLYKKLVFWELELESSNDATMSEILDAQKTEANQQFGRFIEKFYSDWFEDHQSPVMSHTLFKSKIANEISSSQPTLLIVIDNLRYDQWKILEPTVLEK
jgi:CheY-like chemotaxis protein